MPTLVGQVVAGLGDCARWIERFAGAYAAKTGLDLYPGTLNVRLGAPYELPADCLRLLRAEYGGQVDVSIVPCTIGGQRALILRTDANRDGTGPHPPSLIEVAAETRLRDTLALRDGDQVRVEVAD